MIFRRLSEKKEKIEKKKEKLKKEYIECPICSTRLTNPESIVAGIGPYCALKQNFAERLSREDLKSLANKRKAIKEIKEHTTVILKDINDSFFLGTILSKDDYKIFYLDLTSFNQDYSSNENISSSFSTSLKMELVENLEYYSIVDKPSSPDIARQFNKFSSNYKNMLKERQDIEKEISERGLSTNYLSVKIRGDMTDRQKFNRRLLMEMKQDNNERYQLLWENGYVQVNTFLSRIKNNESNESKRIYNFLIAKQEKINIKYNLKIQDHGLTESEILNGTNLSNRKEEYLAIKSFIKGSRNILLVLATLNKLGSVKDLKLKIKLIAEINNMINRKNYNEEDLKKALL
jgi:hypothetical protein